MTRKVNGTYLCRDCNWPMCSNICAKSSNHIEECKLLKSRGSKIKIPWFDTPCSYYDAILPLRVMLLQKTNPKAYNLISILMDHSEGNFFLIREILNAKTVISYNQQLNINHVNLSIEFSDLDESKKKRRQTVVDFLRISCRLSADFSEKVSTV